MPQSRPRSRRAVAVLAAALVLAPACGSSDSGGSDGSTRVVATDIGKVTIPAKPERVVATGYAVPVLIEAKAPLVGISTWPRGVPLMTERDLATYRKLTKIAGKTAAETNYEAIAKADPDVIIIGVPAPVLKDIDVKRLQSIAPVVPIGPSLPSAWRDLSRRQADAAGSLQGFEVAKSAYDKRAAALKARYASALKGLKFGHVGSYGKPASGTFHREFAGAWGTNIAADMGVTYYGQVKEKKGGSSDVSEYPSIEELPASLGDADVITYSVNPDGSLPAQVKYVLDSPLWKNLPAVQAGRAYPFRYTEAATYTQALKTLNAAAAALAPLLEDK